MAKTLHGATTSPRSNNAIKSAPLPGVRAASGTARPRRRPAQSNTKSVVALCAVFGALIVAGIFAAGAPGSLFESAATQRAGALPGAGASSSDTTGSLDPSDPVAQFAKTGVGHMLFAKSNSEECRRVLFDNRTGGMQEVKDLACGREELEKEPVSASAARLEAMQKTFQSKAR
jgi:hypothetical protein